MKLLKEDSFTMRQVCSISSEMAISVAVARYMETMPEGQVKSKFSSSAS
jgi:hypothetical protein